MPKGHPMNKYLERKREQYEALRTSIEGIQTRATDADRDLTEDELRSVREQGETAKALAAEITDLTEIENRNRAVSDLSATLAEPDQTRSGAATGGAQTRDRDPGHYTRGSANSFFGDMHRSRQGDEDAARRLTEHNRALSTGGEGGGIVPPHWLTEEFETLARQGRAVANAVRQIPLGDDPRPMTLPRQSAGTSDVVNEQANENDSVDDTDAWDSNTSTVTPRPTSGIQNVSRQMLDMSNPAIDQLIYGDMIAAYNRKIEDKVVAAMISAAGSAVKAYDDEAAWETDLDDTVVSDDLVNLAIAVRDARKLPADLLIVAVRRYGDLLKMKDGNNRPLIPLDSGGPMNVIGTGSVAVDGRIHGLGVVASDGIASQTYPESILAARAADTLLFESNVMRFRYEQPLGPETVKLGIWGYSAVHVKYNGASVKRNEITTDTAA